MKVKIETGLEPILTQIYGEINRIRLIIGEDSEVGKKIEEFDARHNGYTPFFDSEKNFEKYKAAKTKNGKE